MLLSTFLYLYYYTYKHLCSFEILLIGFFLISLRCNLLAVIIRHHVTDCSNRHSAADACKDWSTRREGVKGWQHQNAKQNKLKRSTVDTAYICHMHDVSRTKPVLLNSRIRLNYMLYVTARKATHRFWHLQERIYRTILWAVTNHNKAINTAGLRCLLCHRYCLLC